MLLTALSLLNLFFGIVSIIVFIKAGVPAYILWFCNHQSIVYALAIWKRNPRWITAELNLGIIPQLLWGIDYLGHVLTGKFIWGITEYMFTQNYAAATYYISLQHFIVAPIALYALYKIGTPTMKDWKLTLAHVAVMIALTFAFTTADYNVNCAYKNDCVPYLPKEIPFWPVVWAIITLIVIILPTNYLLCKLYRLIPSRYTSKTAIIYEYFH